MAETGNAPVQAFGNIARGVDGDGNAAFSCLSYLIRFVINGAADRDSKRMWIFAAVCAGTAFLRVALQVIRSYYAERCRAKITVGLRSRLFTGLLRADYAEAENITAAIF